MTLTIATAPHLDGALLARVHTEDDNWVAHLPAVPLGHRVSLSIAGVDLFPRDVGHLDALGYDFIGVVASGRAHPGSLDIGIPGSVRRACPAWLAEVALLADRVFETEMGPVQMLLGEEIQQHFGDHGDRETGNRP